ncbi:hypothetical protein P7K49_026787 [Saguinus oedipus]|uniref:Uncharacterized protein n=1 Tax=Saguinus oedipus TaxID=9490 RepID=A0ABQ9UEG4_SAGOE|nr:hypothetical protein P7K49_026787 [Saguinus oedipus]
MIWEAIDSRISKQRSRVHGEERRLWSSVEERQSLVFNKDAKDTTKLCNVCQKRDVDLIREVFTKTPRARVWHGAYNQVLLKENKTRLKIACFNYGFIWGHKRCQRPEEECL